ncbi:MULTISPECIES: C40 family peptidase [Amniculibacterium]|jgi:cell wall-associated NlpC family hydrolase|uniref:C40 family peptidase n=1 Tax=Amniculibacterium TaxID=2715289 RepID=UPI000F5A08A5|nr:MULTISPECIES: C40 family peptidase [Amniculibacterium]
MKRIGMALVSVSLFLVSCGAKKVTAYPTSTKTKTENLRKLESKNTGVFSRYAKNILKSADQYLGVPYRYGGATAEGFDCSGLVCKVFDENNKKLPRRSEDQSKLGDRIDIDEVKPGDLLFFATGGGTRVSHVGIVHEIENLGEIRFIHASTSKGVVVSSLNEKYWNKAFLFARRLND